MGDCRGFERGTRDDEEEDVESVDEQFQHERQEAVDASLDDYVLQLQVEEVIALSDLEYARELQIEEVLSASVESRSTYVGSSSNSNPSSSSPPDCVRELTEEVDLNQDEPGKRPRSGCILVSASKRPRRAGKDVVEPDEIAPVKVLCGICLEAKRPSEIFDNTACSHRFCSDCVVQHILAKRREKVVLIQCPEPDCWVHLTPDQCETILPSEACVEWFAALVEADIPETERFYCPFPDCSALLLQEGQEAGCSSGTPIKQSECPLCRRLFCVQCNVPWHAGLDCSDFQKLSPAEKGRDDLMLFSLAKEKQWQRCARCKLMVEKESGCSHMTCRCGFEFCYKCGSEWNDGRVPCNCPGWEE